MVTIKLKNEIMGFSSAHISNIDGQWRLHGHNFQVAIDMEVPSVNCGNTGYFEEIRRKLKVLDHKVIVPENCIVKKQGSNFIASFEGNLFTFPIKDSYVMKRNSSEIVDLLDEIITILSEYDLIRVSLSYDGLTWIEKRIKGLSGG